MSQLANQSVLITGGGSGIGLAAAKLFLQQGARVAITGRDSSKLRSAAQSLGDKVLHHPGDIGDPDQAQAVVDKVIAAHGQVDVLVNNAGLNIKERAMRDMTAERW